MDIQVKRIGGAYFDGRPYQRAKAHIYTFCGYIRGNVYEAPLYSDDGGVTVNVYTTLNVDGEPMSHKNTDLGPRLVPVKRCHWCSNYERRHDERDSRSRS